MKQLLIITAISVSFLTSRAQKLDVSKVPVPVKNSFDKKYQDVKTTWEKEGVNYEASFKRGNRSTSVLIDNNGAILETETDIQINLLPASVSTYTQEHYPGKHITGASKIIKADGSVFYEAEIDKIDVLFDSNGKFVKEDENEAKEKD